MSKFYNDDMEPLLETIKVADSRVLDVGCGNGDKARVMVKSGARVIGIEPDLESWQVEEIQSEGFKLIQGGAEKIDLQDDTVDVIVLMYSFHHVPKHLMQQALSELTRVLDKHGVIYIAEPIARGRYQDVCAPFLDETQIRDQAINAIERWLKPVFEHCREFEYGVAESFSDFDEFSSAMVSYSLNRYEKQDVDTAKVRALFEQCKVSQGYQLDQPVRCWVLYNSSANLKGV